MPIDPHRLLVLRAVRRTGSIQAAAAALYVTASGVSQHLTRLEAETGLRLVDRTRRGGGRPAQLTRAGLMLAGRADGVAAALAEAQRDVDWLRHGSRGTVRVGGFATALGQLVVPVVSHLAVSDPELQSQIFEVDEPDGMKLLRADKLDLLLSERRPETTRSIPGLIEHDLSRDHYRIVVPQIWPTPDSLQQLLAGAWVTGPPGLALREILDQSCALHEVATGTQHVCTDSQTMLNLVAAGLGAAIVPALTLSYLSTAGVNVYATAENIGSRILTVLTPEPEHNAPATSRFQSLLREVASGQA